MNEIIMSLIGIILTGITIPLAKYIASLLQEKASESRHANLYSASIIAVQAAEKIIGSGNGQVKFESVMNKLSKRFKWADELKLTEFIESSVHEMSVALGKKGSSLPTLEG